MRKTRFAGLTALEPGESLFVDGASFVDRNPDIIDHLLEVGARTHRHDAAVALPDPTSPPTVVVYPTGGALPSTTTLLVAYTLLDGKGGETRPSPVSLVTTPAGIVAPVNAPVTEIDYTTGTLTVGTYHYAVTLVDASGGETSASAIANLTRDPGTATAAITISDLASFVSDTPGAVRYRLYRAKDQGKLLLLAEGVLDSIDDDGTLDCDCCTEPPTTNQVSTGQTGALAVTVPLAAIGTAVGWRLYVTDDGEFYSPSLYGTDRTRSEAGVQVAITSLAVDTGAPPDVSTTVAGAAKINPDTDLLNWHWKQPVANVGALPEDADTTNGDVRMALDDGTIYVRRAGDWSPLTAPAAHWMPPVANFSALPATANTNGDVRLTLDTYALYAWADADSAWHAATATSGGGVSFPLDTAAEVSWNDLDGALKARVTLENLRAAHTLYNVDFAGEPDAAPAAGWNEIAYSDGTTVSVASGQLRLNTTNVNRDYWLRYDTAAVYRDAELAGNFTLATANWTRLGAGLVRVDGGGFVYGLRVVLAKAGQVLVQSSGGGGTWTTLSTTAVTAPAVGSTVAVSLARYRDTLTCAVAVVAPTPLTLATVDVDVPSGLLTFDSIPAYTLTETADAAAYLTAAGADRLSSEYELVSYLDERRVLQTTTGVESFGGAGFTLTLAADWHDDDGVELCQDLATGQVLMRGQLSKITGTAPVAGELIATITSDYVFVRLGSVPVVTGDSDGLELGIATFAGSPVSGTELRWGAGRSTDPVTKTPYLSLEGVRR